MDEDKLIEFLRANLRVEVNTREKSDWSSKGYEVQVNLFLGDELISEGKDMIDVAYRDTSETWQRTLD